MNIIGGIDNNTPNSSDTTAKGMLAAGYWWNDEKQHWVKTEASG